ncbi:MAG: sigma-70 family RNA polymerase sigma factor [Planctomycetes bacterium]|nr:sigma-70 family RNA polymerase sigma factor [Planctomycetota bacterium]
MPDRTDKPHDPDPRADFVSLFSRDRDRIFSFIFSMVHRFDDAEDIFQRTSEVLWREFDQFDRSRDFVRWANGIAFNQVRNFRRSQQRDRHVFGDGLVAQIARFEESHSEELDHRWAALQKCLNGLREPDMKLIQAFYSTQATAADLAAESDRSLRSIRKAIHRIRTQLLDCVQRRIREANP